MILWRGRLELFVGNNFWARSIREGLIPFSRRTTRGLDATTRVGLTKIWIRSWAEWRLTGTIESSKPSRQNAVREFTWQARQWRHLFISPLPTVTPLYKINELIRPNMSASYNTADSSCSTVFCFLFNSGRYSWNADNAGSTGLLLTSNKLSALTCLLNIV